MQYYNSRTDRSRINDPLFARAVQLNHAIECAVELARTMYSCDIVHTDCADNAYSAESFEEVIKRITSTMDSACTNRDIVYSELVITQEGPRARFVIKDSFRAVVAECEFLLFVGTPQSVVSDNYDNALKQTAVEFFEQLIKANRRLTAEPATYVNSKSRQGSR